MGNTSWNSRKKILGKITIFGGFEKRYSIVQTSIIRKAHLEKNHSAGTFEQNNANLEDL
jgi:hypothetical protein